MLRPAYSVTGIAITPLLRLWLQRRTVRGKEEAARLSERFGRTSMPRPVGKLIWLHAASVGETQSVLTLVRALLAAHPALHLLITTGTVTSAQLVAQQNLPRTLHQYVPLDTYPAVRRFLAHWRPDLALWSSRNSGRNCCGKPMPGAFRCCSSTPAFPRAPTRAGNVGPASFTHCCNVSAPFTPAQATTLRG